MVVDRRLVNRGPPAVKSEPAAPIGDREPRPSRSTSLGISIAALFVAAAAGLTIAATSYNSERERGTEHLVVIDHLLLASRLDELSTSTLHLVPELADPDDSIDVIVEDLEDETALVRQILGVLHVPTEMMNSITDVVAEIEQRTVESHDVHATVDTALTWAAALRLHAAAIIDTTEAWTDPTLETARDEIVSHLDLVIAARVGTTPGTELDQSSQRLTSRIASIASTHRPELFDPVVDLTWSPETGTEFEDFDQLTELLITATDALRADLVATEHSVSPQWVVLLAAATACTATAGLILAVWSRIRHVRIEADLAVAVGRDELTNLPGRTHLKNTLARQRRRDPSGSVGVLYLDLDGFKVVNDTHGHHVGDQILRAVADRVRAQCRPDDTPARIGGDEFVVLLPGATSRDELMDISERLIAVISEPFRIDGHNIKIGVSIGAAIGGADRDLTMMLREADGALYSAKSAGRGRVAVAVAVRN